MKAALLPLLKALPDAASTTLSVQGFSSYEGPPPPNVDNTKRAYNEELARRRALGLADPVTANQILLWGIAWVCVAGIAVASLIAMYVGGPEIVRSPIMLTSISSLNAAAWICVWLVFFPPRAYQRWVDSARDAVV